MLTRTRNEVLVAGVVALLIGTVGTGYLRMRAGRAREASPTGGVRLRSQVVSGDRCPMLTSWFASPLRTSVGAWIDVGASATDADLGESVGYAWEPAGNFAPPNAAATRYRCAEAGRRTLTLEIFDDHRPRSCTTRLDLEVDCVAR
jgi:hypothetical protein